MIAIYTLSDNDIPFYVGKTYNIKKREYNHKQKYKNCKLDVIDTVNLGDWRFWEKHYISLYYSWGFNLKKKKLRREWSKFCF